MLQRACLHVGGARVTSGLRLAAIVLTTLMAATAHAQAPIRIGALLSLTGSFAAFVLGLVSSEAFAVFMVVAIGCPERS